jgi:hypothetical protein
MSSQPDIRVVTAIFMSLGCSGCTLLFQETATNEASDAGPAADADPSDICTPHACEVATKAFYRFEPGGRFRSECPNENLIGTAPIDANSQAGLGHALGLRSDSYAKALVGSVGASWTVDFWLSPRPNRNGELLSVIEGAAYDTTPCGLRLAVQGGELEVFKYQTDSNTLVGSAVLTMQEWHHIVMTYDHSANSADLSIDGAGVGAFDVGTCDKSETALIIGNWEDDTDTGVETELDELRLQEGVVLAAPCAND